MPHRDRHGARWLDAESRETIEGSAAAYSANTGIYRVFTIPTVYAGIYPSRFVHAGYLNRHSHGVPGPCRAPCRAPGPCLAACQCPGSCAGARAECRAHAGPRARSAFTLPEPRARRPRPPPLDASRGGFGEASGAAPSGLPSCGARKAPQGEHEYVL